VQIPTQSIASVQLDLSVQLIPFLPVTRIAIRLHCFSYRRVSALPYLPAPKQPKARTCLSRLFHTNFEPPIPDSWRAYLDVLCQKTGPEEVAASDKIEGVPV
jgi:hypothetical protein